MALGMDPTLMQIGGADPCSGETAGRQRRSRAWLAMLLVLAAGWGALFGYSAVFLSEDLPFRQGQSEAQRASVRVDPVVPEIPEELLRSVASPRQRIAEEPRHVPAPPAREAAAPPQPVVEEAPPPIVAPPRTERAEYIGTWGPTGAACGALAQRGGYIPATITADAARAGETLCRFHDGRRVDNGWVMTADCSDRGRRWSSQVRLVVEGDRLTWTSGKGSSSYVRCSRRTG